MKHFMRLCSDGVVTLVTSRHAAPLLALCAALAAAPGNAPAATALADQPVFTNTAVAGNVALALSVEYPTAVSVAHTDTTYSSANTYIGYFDPAKCYLYKYNTDETQRYFYPAGLAATRICTGSQGDKWSGNFLNWATMQTIDPFRWALTGGYRSTDTTTLTLLEKAWASGQGGASNFPDRSLGTSTLVADNTPFSESRLRMRIQGLGNKLRFTTNGDVNAAGTPTVWDPSNSFNNNTVYELSVRVKVCDTNTGTAGPMEANCTAYPSGTYKPTGLVQQYANKVRYSAFGYLADGSLTRDGGVLRARQKFVGPTITVPNQPDAPNPATEWDENTGIIAINPDATDASDTAAQFGVTITNSGVINYLNKFGEITRSNYKTYDPVSELYYAVLRYFKNLGNVPEWTSMTGATTATKTTWADGFPVITTWNDPIQYSCQRNFVLGIGDVNTHADKNVPGATSSTNEPTKPASVSADTATDAVTATNVIGNLHGLGATLGNTNPYGGCCNNNSALIAGMAWYANTTDIRPDDPAKPQTAGMQNLRTYWVDVLEFSTYKKDNQYYLASKYGGFKVPKNFNPATQTTDIPAAWWTTSGTTVGTGATSQPRPDTYYTAAQADQMVAGLRGAFSSIVNELRAYTTSFATALPRVAYNGVASYATTYDASTWTGDLIASTATFDQITGEPTIVDAWSFRTKLATQLAGTGWNTNRRVVTFNPSTSAGIPFRAASLTSTQNGLLDTVYRTSNDSSDYLNYLRGDTTNEEASSATGSARSYRTREALVGDIVGSKAKPVGPPSEAYSSATNPGYSTFKTTYATRPTIVYFGTNAGMLHAVDGSLTGATAGKEVFAYVPNMVFNGPTGTPVTNGLQSVGDPDFTHHAFVDGTANAFDLDFARTSGGSGSADWRTVLIGSMGKGGKGYYAIDVTNPAGMTTEAIVASKVLWEFTHTDLGYTYSDPVVVKTAKYGWVVIFGSGYNNTDGQGYFFIVNPRTGQLLEKIGTGAGGSGTDAGLAHVQAYMPDRTDGTADTVYAGDLLGNLWRLDLRGTGAYPAPLKLAQLTNASNEALPVTSRPLVVVQPGTSKRYITVGTGRLLDNSDVGSTQLQGFFAIMDGTEQAPGTAAQLPTGVSYPIQRTNLKKLTDLTLKTSFSPTQMGWWIDLGTGTGGLGWRVNVDPTAFNGIVAFTSLLPSGDVCSPSGSSRVYAIDLGTGQSALYTGSGNTTTTVSFLTTVSGVIGDLRFYSVSGKPRLIAGSDKGEVKNQSGNWSSSVGARRLNWRELPLAN